MTRPPASRHAGPKSAKQKGGGTILRPDGHGWGVRASGRGSCGAETVGAPIVGAGRGCRGVAPAREPERPRGWHQQERGPSLTAKAQRHVPEEGRMKDDPGAPTAARRRWTPGGHGPVFARGHGPSASAAVASRWTRRPPGSAAVRLAGATTWSVAVGTPTWPHSEDRHCASLPTLSHIEVGTVSATSTVFVLRDWCDWSPVRGAQGQLPARGSISHVSG
jgi:hypothetical protein